MDNDDLKVLADELYRQSHNWYVKVTGDNIPEMQHAVIIGSVLEGISKSVYAIIKARGEKEHETKTSKN